MVKIYVVDTYKNYKIISTYTTDEWNGWNWIVGNGTGGIMHLSSNELNDYLSTSINHTENKLGQLMENYCKFKELDDA